MSQATNKPQICSTCRFWKGDEKSYRASCNRPDHSYHATAFNDTSRGWMSKNGARIYNAPATPNKPEQP